MSSDQCESDTERSGPEANEVHHNGSPDRYVMLSGGMDSAAMAYYLFEEKWSYDYGPWNKRPVAIYCSTGIGLSAQRIYVEMLCKHYGWQLWTLHTHEDFWEHSEDEGFYGNQQHDKIYKRLKGRQQSKLATTSGNPHVYYGTRRAESPARRDIPRTNYDEGKGAWTHNPICDWSDKKVGEYIQRNEIPFNPLWEAPMPTDCACGATAAREELIELEAEGFEVFAQKIRDLEDRVETGDRREKWAWGSFSDKEKRALDSAADDAQCTLMCGPNCGGKAKVLRAETDGGHRFVSNADLSQDGDTQ